MTACSSLAGTCAGHTCMVSPSLAMPMLGNQQHHLISHCSAHCCLHARATLVGATSFGKGVIQYYFPIGQDGAGLKLTVAKYLTPSGHDITRSGGLKPDVQCHAAPRVQPSAVGGLDDCVLAALKLVTDGHV